MVWKLIRLGRSLPHLIEAVKSLDERSNGFRSLRKSIDTTTSKTKLEFHVFAALTEFEHEASSGKGLRRFSSWPAPRKERGAGKIPGRRGKARL